MNVFPDFVPVNILNYILNFKAKGDSPLTGAWQLLSQEWQGFMCFPKPLHFGRLKNVT